MNWTSSICRDRALPLAALAALVLGVGPGCRQVRGRKMIQDANDRYRHGKYHEAVALFAAAEALVPELPVLWLNKGYTCRQLLIPGGRARENREAAACALDAFARLKELRPTDPRGDQLYVQTLFDADDLTALEALYLDRNRQQPDDLDTVRGLQQVTFKAGKWPAALQWSRRAAALRPRDAESQYGVGTFIWQVLSSRGGGAEMAAFDPRPRLPEARDDDPPADGAGAGGRKGRRRGQPAPPPPPVPVAPAPPPMAANDITGALRVELADEGIAALQKALALRPRYPEAMTYLGLLYRQKSLAYFAQPEKWQAAVDEAKSWQEKAGNTGRAPGKP